MREGSDITTEERNSLEPSTSPYQLQQSNNGESEHPRTSFEHESSASGLDVSVSEILYSASSYHAMVVPGEFLIHRIRSFDWKWLFYSNVLQYSFAKFHFYRTPINIIIFHLLTLNIFDGI